MSILDNSYGPADSASAVTTTGGKTWIKPRSVLSNWGFTIITAGSATTITSKYKLEGTLSESTAPSAADIYDMSTGSGAGHTRVTGMLARQVRINVTALSSTSSTPTLSAVVAGSIGSGDAAWISSSSPLPVTTLSSGLGAATILGNDSRGEAAVFQVLGTWVGTFTFEAQVNGSTAWASIMATNAATNALALTSTVNGIFRVVSDGLDVRARFSTWASGTALVRPAKRIV